MTSGHYPPELRTPPLPLVAFVGRPEFHKEVGAFFSHVLRPPIITVGIAEPHEHILAKLFGARKPAPIVPGPPAGIIKADWFVKHRQRKASVALAIVGRPDIDGDPSNWNRMLYQLRVIRDAAGSRGAGFIVAVIQDATASDLPADRVAAVCGHLQLEPRLFVLLNRPANYSPGGGSSEAGKQQYDAALKGLGKLALELSCTYYAGEVQRRIQKHSVRMAQQGGSCPAELNARVAFKLAVMAEFRQEWSAAIAQYQAAYAHCKEVTMGVPLSYQRHAEVTRVAEQVHFKIMMLLLHQNRFDEAVQQLQQHCAHYLHPPEPLPPPAAASHLGWVSRQFQVAADMLRSKLEASPALLAPREASPPYLQLSAAQAGIRRRQAVEAAWQQRSSTPLAVDVSSVKRGPYVGQVLLRTDAGVRDLSDAEYLLYLEAEEGKVHHTGANLELLSGALLAFKDTPLERVRCHLGVLMAQEHFLANSLPNARKLLLQVSHTYRRDGWDAPLLQVLGQLRECAQRLKSPREYVAFTLEITALHNTLDPATNKKTADIALSTLRTGISAIKGSIMKTSSPDRALPSPRGSTPSDTPPSASTSAPSSALPQVTSRFDYTIEHLDLKELHRPPPPKSPRDPPEAPRPPLSADLFLRHHQQDFGWWRCIGISAGFTPTTSDPPHLDFHLALHNNLPTALPLQRLEVHFSDDQGDFLALASPTPPTPLAPPSPSRPCAPPTDPPPVPSPSQSPLPSPRGSRPTTNPATSAALTIDPPPPADPSSGSGGPSTCTSATTASSSGSSWPAQSLQPCKLRPQQWQELHVRVVPRAVGRLRAVAAVMVVSDFCTLTWKLASFPPGHLCLGSPHPALPSPPFRAHQAMLPGVFHFHVHHVGRLPTLELHAPQLPLCCEHTPLVCTITAAAGLPACELDVSIKSSDPTLTPSHLTLHFQDPTSPDPTTPTPISIDGHRIRLPALPAATPLRLPLFLRCTRPCRVTLAATLFCPAIIHRSLELTFRELLEYQARFTSEASTHTLQLPAKALPTAGGAAVMPTAGAPSAGPGSMPLTIGQPVLLTVLARALQDCALQLLHASVELAPDSGLQLMSELDSQLEPSGVVLCGGDVHTFLLHICPTTLSTTPSMGNLLLKFRRCPPPLASQPWPSPPSAPSAPSALPSPAPTSPQTTSPSQPTKPPDPATPPPPLDTLQLAFPLPRATVQESMLSVRVVSPPQATAGIAFSFSLQVQNFTALPQDLHISMTDTQGFVCDGDKEQTLAVLPRDKSSCMWLLVAHHSGQLLLPSLRVAALRYNCSVLSQRSHVYVSPF